MQICHAPAVGQAAWLMGEAKKGGGVEVQEGLGWQSLEMAPRKGMGRHKLKCRIPPMYLT